MTSFKQLSVSYKDIIDSYIKNVLTQHFQDERSILEAATLYSSLATGKRIRPLLAIASYLLLNTSPLEHILPYAAATELIHTYSLIHDDLPAMDNDDFRRGLPTSHKKFGENIAILAGDTLNTFAFELISRECGAFFKPENVLKALSYFTHQCGASGLIGGQVLDLKNDHNSQATLDCLVSIHTRKTAALIQACVAGPGILAGCPEVYIDHLKQFGLHLGLLFQIVDDILDVTGTIESLGKSPNKDHTQDKLTYVSLCGLKEAQSLAEKEYQLAIQHLHSIDQDTHILEDLCLFVKERDH